MFLRNLCALAVLGVIAIFPARSAEDPVTVDAATEEVLRGALRWLAVKQNVNGSWNAGENRRGEHPVAMTGYVLMAFMATGNLPEEGEYAKQVKAGLDFLLDSIGLDGTYRGVDGSKYMYNHGIATIALGELYGQSRSPVIREKLQRAIRLIVTTQSDRGSNKGGWRYQPRPADADISITVLQVVALRAAKNAGIDVPQKTIDDAVDYVRRCSVPGGGFAYQAGQWGGGFARTAAAIYSLQVCGHYADPLVQPGSEYLFARIQERRFWTYGANYAAPAQYMIGGDTWRRWYALMKTELLPRVQRNGDQCSWDDREIGNIYATACHTTILAMPWHYIPLYQKVTRTLLRMWTCGAPLMCASLLHAGTVLTTDGAIYDGDLKLDHGIVAQRAGIPVKLPFSSILRARFAPPSPLLQPGLVLVNGGRIAGAFTSLSAAFVKIPVKNITLPSKEIAWAIYQPVNPALAAQAPKGKTGALLRNGDFFEGTSRASDASTVKMLSTIFGPRTFGAAELNALVLRDLQTQPAAFEVLTRDGSLYPALDIIADDSGQITVRHPLTNGLRLPLSDLAEIRASRSRMVALDEVPPTRVEIPPGREAAASFAANRAIAGGALKLGARTVTAGFECATGAAVWWKPPPAAGTFFAIVAPSAATPAGQRLTFSVYADGKVAGRSAPLAAGDPPAVLRCAVPGAESLVLRIEGTGGAESTGTWAEPMLLIR